MGYGADLAEERAIDELVRQGELEIIQSRLQKGIHTTKDGTQIPLEKMTDGHLRNCINFFGLPKDNPYYKELERRFTNP